MASYQDDEYAWSQETLTLKEIVDRGEVPTVVRVSDGIYSTNDSETFSNGDLLKLDFVKTITKVSARIVSARYDDTGQFIEEDKYGYLKSKGDILIPLGYNGKVKIVRMEGFKRYHSVKHLLQDFPRFVRVDKPITAFTTSNQCITISSGSKIELKKEIENNKLVCLYGGKNIILDCRANGVFVALDDDTFYTLQEVVDTFRLPQFVRFVDAEFKKVMTESLDEALENFIQYSGPLQLLYTTQQRVIVGHHKPMTLDKQNSKFCRRALAILPLDNKNVCEIPCQVPIYSGSSDEYQLLVARSFDNTSTDALDGGLYLEFAKNPKIHLIESINELLGPSAQQDDTRPPIPPRTWLDNKDDDDDIYEIQEDVKSPTSSKQQDLKGPPKVKPRTPSDNKTVQNPPPVPERNYHQGLTSSKKSEVGQAEYTTGAVIADLSFHREQSMREKHLSTVPEKIKHQMKEMHKQLVKFVRSKSFRNKESQKPKKSTEPKKSMPSIVEKDGDDEEDEDDDDESNEYDYPDLSRENLPKYVPKKVLDQQTTPNMVSGPKFIPSAAVQAHPVRDGQRPNVIKSPGITVKTSTPKPEVTPGKKPPNIAYIQPQTRNNQGDNKDRPHREETPHGPVRQKRHSRSSFVFTNSSVGDVIKLLTSCGLNKMADKCKDQTLDGKILSDFNDHDLLEGFSLSSVQLKKFRLLCDEGWTPNMGQKRRNTPTNRPCSFLFSELSIIEILPLLKANGLFKMATECEKESLDGRFLSKCDNKELREYFSLNSIELKKFELVKKEGYTPRVS